MKQNKFIEFFKKKQVKVVLGILIIAGIMTAISIGIIAFIRSLRQPPDDPDCESGKEWNKELTQCVPKDCKNICYKDQQGLKGICLDDMCNGENLHSDLIIDKTNCGCKLECTNGNKSINTNTPNVEYTQMIKDSNGLWKEKDTLVCGKDCIYSNNSYCKEGSECKISIGDGGNILNKGCWGNTSDNSDFDIPKSNFSVCNNQDVICETSSDKYGARLYSCKESNVENSRYGKFNSYCKSLNKCGVMDSLKEIICAKNSDCSIEGSSGNCIINSNEEFINKGMLYLGTCENSKEIRDDYKYCANPKYVGELKNNHNTTANPSVNEIAYILNEKQIQSRYEGISLNQPQCYETLQQTQPKCNNVTNKWYCYQDEACGLIDSNDTISSCTESPPNTLLSSDYKAQCCKTENFTKGDLNFCCPAKTSDDGLCLNISKYSPNPKWLRLNEDTTFSCSEDNHCKKYTDSLLQSLNNGITSNDELAQNIISDNEYYSDLFCDKKKNKCKFFTGYVDKVKNQSNIISGKNQFIMGNDNKHKHSEAVRKDNNFLFTGIQPEPAPTDANLPLCWTSYKELDSIRFGLYNDDGSVKKESDRSKYFANSFVTYDKMKSDPTITDCLNYAKNQKGYYVADESYTENSINYNSESVSLLEGSCSFNINCLEYSNSVNDSRNTIDWSFDPKSFPENGIKKSSSTQNISFLRENDFSKVPQNDLKLNSDNICSTIKPTGSNCEEPRIPFISIPEEWSKLEKNFKPICKYNSDGGGHCELDSDNLPQYRIKTGTYCANGFTYDNSTKDYSCLKPTKPARNI